MRKPTKEQVALLMEAALFLGACAMFVYLYFDGPPGWLPLTEADDDVRIERQR